MAEAILQGKFLHAFFKVFDFTDDNNKPVHIERFTVTILDDDALGDPYLDLIADLKTGQKLGLDKPEVIKGYSGKMVTVKGDLYQSGKTQKFRVSDLSVK